MTENTASSDTTGSAVPLLESGVHGAQGGRWWNKVLDVEEAKNHVLFSLPMILTNVFYYLITLVLVMFAGHLGELELAGATLANSWVVVNGFAFMGYGLTETGGGATRMADAEEAKQYASVGRLAENLEVKIVDPEIGEALPPGQRGELWLRGPTIMKG